MTTATQADPRFALRLAEASLFRAKAAQAELYALETMEGTLGPSGEDMDKASRSVSAAEAQLYLAQADFIEHYADGPTIEQCLMRLAEAVEVLRHRP